MDFVEIEVNCLEDFREILMAEMSELDYGTFMETDTGFKGYIEIDKYLPEPLKNILKQYNDFAKIDYSITHVKEKNWNEEWEKNYDPVIIDDTVLIKASFHNLEKKYPYEILINPKMSFGTGHHETTYLMGSHQLEIDHKGKHVLDIGCGTGILAILAAKLGASKVLGIDNHDWAYNNATENVLLNCLNNLEIRMGTIYETDIATKFDLIIANINLHVLLNELSDYVRLLNDGGGILISGFYEQDEPELMELMLNEGFQLTSRKTKNRWCALYFTKK